MKKLLLSISGSLCLSGLSAQDLHFSQSSLTPQLINPAATGVMDGWERVIVNHRNQWLGAGTQFMTTAIAADANFFKPEHRPGAHIGVGLMFFTDTGGDSKFGNQAGTLSLNGILPMGDGSHVMSLGIQGGYGQRTADISNIVFENQWNGAAFDPDIVSGEANSLSSFVYIDASAGIQYMFDGGQSTFARDNDFKFKAGVAGFHLNRPEMNYTNGTIERLHEKYVGHMGFESDIAGTVWGIDASAVQFIQGGHFETLLGFMMRYRFEDNTKITGNSQDAFFGFGMYTRIKDGIIPSVMVDWRGFRLGISYDVTLSALRRAYRGGSLEFSLSYINKEHAIFKSRKRRL